MNKPLNPYERYEISGLSQQQQLALLLRKQEQYAGQITETREENLLWEKPDIVLTAATKRTVH